MPLADDDEFDPDVVTADVAACPRCGAAHIRISFRPLTNHDPAAPYRVYGLCPTTNQPVLATIEVVGEKAEEPGAPNPPAG